MLRALVAPLLVLLLLYVALCAMMWLAQGAMIFLRQPLDPQAASVARASGAHELRISAEREITLHGWLRLAQVEGPAPLLIYFGGNAEEVSWMQGEFARLPHIGVATFNYRGYGLSTGEPGEAQLARDAVSLFDALSARAGTDPQRVVIVGRSLGTGVAVHLAAARAVRAVVLISPYDSLTAVAARAYPWLPVPWLMRHPFDSLSRAPAIDAPLLALVAGDDAVVPPAHSRALVDAWRGPRTLELLPGADHNDLLSHPAFWPAVTRFLQGAVDRTP